jgi:exopolysaccharide biosynthesis WecB/TagA/CpsF family protein
MQTVHRAVGTWREYVNGYITCSHFAREKLLQAGLPGEQVFVKPNFVNPDTRIGSGAGRYAVFVGRLSPEKGIETILEAWKLIPFPIQLKVVGDGPLAECVRSAAQADSRIEWLGWQPLETVLQIIGDASMLLMPSIWYEIFGRTIVESFSKGTPVIVSRLGAMAELVDDGRTGFHVTPGDPHDLAQKVLRMQQDEPRREAFRLACRQEFEAKYTAAKNYQQLIDIYTWAQQSAASPEDTVCECAGLPVPIATPASSSSSVSWPAKLDVFGVHVTPTTYEEAVAIAMAAARQRQSSVISCHAVHAIVTTATDPALMTKVNCFDMVTPDGQPVRWALNILHGTKLSDRVYGPELMFRLCVAAAREGIGVYLYGGAEQTLTAVREKLCAQIPELMIAGSESPPFRPLTQRESKEAVDRINNSNAGLVFIGLGCPKQDNFAAEHRNQIHAVQVCVGAAFDFHAGTVRMAPPWMQKRGLEWLFRLYQEPRRLWRRYLFTNCQFALKFSKALFARYLVEKSLHARSEESRPAGLLNTSDA